jgi:hypothetical protein
MVGAMRLPSASHRTTPEDRSPPGFYLWLMTVYPVDWYAMAVQKRCFPHLAASQGSYDCGSMALEEKPSCRRFVR